jgi:hypothetical protein
MGFDKFKSTVSNINIKADNQQNAILITTENVAVNNKSTPALKAFDTSPYLTEHLERTIYLRPQATATSFIGTHTRFFLRYNVSSKTLNFQFFGKSNVQIIGAEKVTTDPNNFVVYKLTLDYAPEYVLSNFYTSMFFTTMTTGLVQGYVGSLILKKTAITDAIDKEIYVAFNDNSASDIELYLDVIGTSKTETNKLGNVLGASSSNISSNVDIDFIYTVTREERLDASYTAEDNVISSNNYNIYERYTSKGWDASRQPKDIVESVITGTENIVDSIISLEVDAGEPAITYELKNEESLLGLFFENDFLQVKINEDNSITVSANRFKDDIDFTQQECLAVIEFVNPIDAHPIQIIPSIVKQSKKYTTFDIISNGTTPISEIDNSVVKQISFFMLKKDQNAVDTPKVNTIISSNEWSAYTVQIKQALDNTTPPVVSSFSKETGISPMKIIFNNVEASTSYLTDKFVYVSFDISDARNGELFFFFNEGADKIFAKSPDRIFSGKYNEATKNTAAIIENETGTITLEIPNSSTTERTFWVTTCSIQKQPYDINNPVTNLEIVANSYDNFLDKGGGNMRYIDNTFGAVGQRYDSLYAQFDNTILFGSDCISPTGDLTDRLTLSCLNSVFGEGAKIGSSNIYTNKMGTRYTNRHYSLFFDETNSLNKNLIKNLSPQLGMDVSDDPNFIVEYDDIEKELIVSKRTNDNLEFFNFNQVIVTAKDSASITNTQTTKTEIYKNYDKSNNPLEYNKLYLTIQSTDENGTSIPFSQTFIDSYFILFKSIDNSETISKTGLELSCTGFSELKYSVEADQINPPVITFSETSFGNFILNVVPSSNNIIYGTDYTSTDTRVSWDIELTGSEITLGQDAWLLIEPINNFGDTAFTGYATSRQLQNSNTYNPSEKMTYQLMVKNETHDGVIFVYKFLNRTTQQLNNDPVVFFAEGVATNNNISNLEIGNISSVNNKEFYINHNPSRNSILEGIINVQNPSLLTDIKTTSPYISSEDRGYDELTGVYTKINPQNIGITYNDFGYTCILKSKELCYYVDNNIERSKVGTSSFADSETSATELTVSRNTLGTKPSFKNMQKYFAPRMLEGSNEIDMFVEDFIAIEDNTTKAIKNSTGNSSGYINSQTFINPLSTNSNISLISVSAFEADFVRSTDTTINTASITFTRLYSTSQDNDIQISWNPSQNYYRGINYNAGEPVVNTNYQTCRNLELGVNITDISFETEDQSRQIMIIDSYFAETDTGVVHQSDLSSGTEEYNPIQSLAEFNANSSQLYITVPNHHATSKFRINLFVLNTEFDVEGNIGRIPCANGYSRGATGDQTYRAYGQSRIPSNTTTPVLFESVFDGYNNSTLVSTTALIATGNNTDYNVTNDIYNVNILPLEEAKATAKKRLFGK